MFLPGVDRDAASCSPLEGDCRFRSARTTTGPARARFFYPQNEMRDRKARFFYLQSEVKSTRNGRGIEASIARCASTSRVTLAVDQRIETRAHAPRSISGRDRSHTKF